MRLKNTTEARTTINDNDWIRLSLEDDRGWAKQSYCYQPSQPIKDGTSIGSHAGIIIGGNPYAAMSECQSVYTDMRAPDRPEFQNLTGRFMIEELDHSV